MKEFFSKLVLMLMVVVCAPLFLGFTDIRDDGQVETTTVATDSQTGLYQEEVAELYPDVGEGELNFEPTSSLRNIHAGRRIYRRVLPLVYSWAGTVGPKASCNITGRTGILTHGHISSGVGTTLAYQPLGSSITYEVGQLARRQVGGRIDAAFTPFRNLFTWEFTPSAAYGNTVIPRIYIGDRNDIRAWAPVVAFGSTTGRTVGYIVSTDAESVCRDGIVLRNQIRHTALTLEGDSGGPLFTIDSAGRHILIGINIRSNFPSGGDTAVASNIFNIMEDLNVTVRAHRLRRIRTFEDLAGMHIGTLDSFILENDIDLTGHFWHPIENFRGTFDGNGHTIKNLRITRSVSWSGENRGLFQNNFGEIRNLRLYNVYIANRDGVHYPGVGMSNIGSLVGVNRVGGRIINVQVCGTLVFHRTSSALGGVVGRNYGLIQYVRFGLPNVPMSGFLEGSGDIGGIAGVNVSGGRIEYSRTHSTLIRCYHVNNNRSIGGIVGFNNSSLLYRVHVSDTKIVYINEETNDNRAPFVGIIVGYIRNNSRVWYSTRENVVLDSGTLADNQTVHFGRTSPWSWGGLEGPGSHDVRITASMYNIYTAQDLCNIRRFPSGNFRLVADIDLSVFSQWSPIPNFRGTLDGNGYTISNMSYVRPGASVPSHQYIGLFAYMYGTVRNLTIMDSRIQIESNHNGNGWIMAGLVTGWLGAGGLICSVDLGYVGASGITNTVWVSRDRSMIGGLVGESRGIIRNSRSIGVRMYGNGDIGGIVGGTYGGQVYNNTFMPSDSHALVWHWRVASQNNNRSIGGIVGLQDSGAVHSNLVHGLIIQLNTTAGGTRYGTIVGHFRNTNENLFHNNTSFDVWRRIGDTGTLVQVTRQRSF